MAKGEKSDAQQGREGVISIIGPGMRVVGDCQTDGTLRIEGSVKGTVRAGKAVVLGKEGVIEGDIITQDAVVGGRVTGSILAESRLELQATCTVEGEIKARRIKLDEGGAVQGSVHVGEVSARSAVRGTPGTQDASSPAGLEATQAGAPQHTGGE
jgi:cytoskeletal protein CcmA (bactofilin family)